MGIPSKLQDCLPGTLIGARNMAHGAVQLITKAARANVPALADDSHTNLGWDAARGAFITHPLAAGGQDLFVGLTVTDLTLQIIRDQQTTASIDLAGVAQTDAFAWLDNQLSQAGLAPASAVSSPYDLPSDVTGISTYSTEGLSPSLATLSAWYALADSVLTKFVAAHADIQPGPSAVRCWPHHFDIATYVSLESGPDARAVGIGMSPGDEYYAQPYFYVNPVPAPPSADDLPQSPSPGHWHTQDFVGAVATGDEVFSLLDVESGLAEFIYNSFAIGRRKLST